MKLEIICHSGLHCTTCRTIGDGRDWRRSLTAHYDVPGGLVDFACPEGKPWLADDEAPTLELAQRLQVAVEEAALVREIDKRPEGLGDTVKSMIETIGADRAAALFRKLTGLKGCNCEKRRQWLNKWWPYK